MTKPVFRYECFYLDRNSTPPVISEAKLLVGCMEFDMKVDEENAAVVTRQFVETDLTELGLYPTHVEAMVETATDDDTEDFPQAFPERGFLVFEVGPFLPNPALSDVTPSVREVAQSWLMARTRSEHGKKIGTFNFDTNIHYEQALTAIQNAVDEILPKIGTFKPKFAPNIKVLVTILAAANLELSFYPEQSNETNMIYTRLMDRYALLWDELQSALEGDMLDDMSAMGPAAWGFPPSPRFGTRPL